MSEVAGSIREARGHWRPDECTGTVPLWAWPPRPLATLKWIVSYPGFLFPWNAVYVLIAIATWLYLQPELSRTAEFRLDWMAEMYFRNFAFLVVWVGGWHLRLYRFRGQASAYKFNPNWPGGKDPTFLSGSQLRDNVFWTLTSACMVWTAYDAISMWAYANNLIPFVDWRTQPVYFTLLMLTVPFWREVHFYLVHRLIHWRPLYRTIHYLHHKNVNIGPWSGMAMHPIEHVLYFSVVALYWLVPSHPLHVIFTLQHTALAPAVGHAGFEQFTLKGKASLPTGGFFHYLHHRHFECNYGGPAVPLDRWLGTFHDGTPEMHAKMQEKWRKGRRGYGSFDEPTPADV